MELVNDVLDMNKLESGQIKLEEKPFSISEILKEVETVVGMAATEHGITLTVKKGEINHENLLEALFMSGRSYKILLQMR